MHRKPFKPSAELREAVGKIVESVRPELTERQRDRVTDIVAREVRPKAKTVDLRQVRHTRKEVARAIGDKSEAPLPHPRPLH